MQGRVVLVTGASSGIGLAAARALAAQGAHVVLHARSPERGEDALRAVREAGGKHAELVLADLSAQRGVRALAEEVRGRHPRLDVLLNNAGAVFGRRQFTEDRLERTLALNHLAPVLLTHLLLPALRAVPEARVVTVASDAHRFAPGWFDFRGERPHVAWGAYADSKLGNVLFTRELARRLAETKVTATCLHPGVVRTGFGRGSASALGLALRLTAPLLRSPERGADTAVWLASAHSPGPSGRYFKDRRQRRPSRKARDAGLAARVWAESERLVGLA